MASPSTPFQKLKMTSWTFDTWRNVLGALIFICGVNVLGLGLDSVELIQRDMRPRTYPWILSASTGLLAAWLESLFLALRLSRNSYIIVELVATWINVGFFTAIISHHAVQYKYGLVNCYGGGYSGVGDVNCALLNFHFAFLGAGLGLLVVLLVALMVKTTIAVRAHKAGFKVLFKPTQTLSEYNIILPISDEATGSSETAAVAAEQDA